MRLEWAPLFGVGARREAETRPAIVRGLRHQHRHGAAIFAQGRPWAKAAKWRGPVVAASPATSATHCRPPCAWRRVRARPAWCSFPNICDRAHPLLATDTCKSKGGHRLQIYGVGKHVGKRVVWIDLALGSSAPVEPAGTRQGTQQPASGFRPLEDAMHVRAGNHTVGGHGTVRAAVQIEKCSMPRPAGMADVDLIAFNCPVERGPDAWQATAPASARTDQPLGAAKLRTYR